MLDERIQRWDKPPAKGKYILYRMQASVRFSFNLALNYAVDQANEHHLPLRILFTLDPAFPDANRRHFQFLCQGVLDFATRALDAGYDFVLESDVSRTRIQHHLNHAALVVLDKGYLRIQRQWADQIIADSPVSVVMIEDNLLVPITACTNKQEWAARTLRSKIMRQYLHFLSDIVWEKPAPLQPELFSVFTLSALEDQLNSFLQHYHGATLPEVQLRGGESEASLLWEHFLRHKFEHYATDRNDPSLHGASGISPYLHFGHTSPLALLAAMNIFLHSHPNAPAYDESRDTLVEQLVVRRELAHNYIWFNLDYDRFRGLPQWCIDTFEKHARDERPYLYTTEELEQAQTHDPYWNRAMHEMVTTGSMENTMRMYWGKKIIEWSATAEEAYDRTLYLNNKYFLDGRDANSYVGVGWCFGLHDRPWAERPVFGTIRYMNLAGLERKYNMKEY
ncbi:MAG: deoxyribodipyrimidine photo-lyase [Bacteroidales bacterium]